jgi:hypothetical protein
MISGKFSQKIVNSSVRFRTGSVERKYAPSPVSLVYGYEALANGARRNDPVVETPIVNNGFSLFGLRFRCGVDRRFRFGRGALLLFNGLTIDAADDISRRVGMSVAADRRCQWLRGDRFRRARAVRGDVDRR